MRTLMTMAALLAIAAPAAAQHEGHGAGGGLPAGWQGRVDRDTQKLEDARVMTMGNRFHVITGPHVILWNPDSTATGSYTAAATFTQTKTPEHPEGYGLLVGGRDLDQPQQDYLYFLIRHDGRYMIRHRAGTEVHTLAEWTAHDAIVKPADGASAANTLTIESGAASVRFMINGTEVRALDRVPMLNTDGLVGFRIGHNLDVLIAGFTTSVQ